MSETEKEKDDWTAKLHPFDSLYEPLGAFVVQFAELESQVSAAINALLPADPLDAVALEWLMPDFRRRIELFHFLSKRKAVNDEHKNYARKIVAGISQANKDRNNLLHGRWSGRDEGGGFHKVRLQTDGGKISEIPVHDITPTLIVSEVEYVMALCQHLSSWTAFYRLKAAPPAWPIPSPDKWPKRTPLNNLLQG